MRELKPTELQTLKDRQEELRGLGISKLRTAIYARKSAEDERQTSLPTQIELCKAFIARYPMLELTKIYKEDGVSGMFTEKRAEYLDMLSAAERGELDAIVVVRLDRLGRDLADMTTAIKLLRAYRCILLAGDDIGEETAVGEFVRSIQLCQNQYQARVTANRVMESEIHNVKQGDSAGGIAPFGLQIVDKRYEIDEKEAPAVKLMFDMAARGKSYREIIDALTAQGYTTRRGEKFSYSTLNSLLRNEKFCGTYLYNRKDGKKKADRVLIEKYDEVRNHGAIPQIVSQETFDKVQDILDRRVSCRPNLDSHSEYVLTGKLYCQACGSTMCGMANYGGRSRSRIRTYICPKHRPGAGKVCATKAINAEYLESAVKNAVFSAVCGYVDGEGNLDATLKSIRSNFTQEIAAVKKRNLQLGAMISRLLNQAASSQSPVIAQRYEVEAANTMAIEAKNEARIKELSALVVEIDGLLTGVSDRASVFTQNLLLGSPKLTRELIEVYINRITVDDAGDEISIEFRDSAEG